MYGGAEHLKRYIVGASFANAGVLAFAEGNTGVGGVIPITATSQVDTLGLGLEASTYDATPFGGTLGTMMISKRSDSVIAALLSGAAAEGTALTTLTNTAADLTLPDTVTSTDIEGSDDLVSGTCWRLQSLGDEAGIEEYREILTHNTAISLVLLPDLTTAINVNDQFLHIGYADTAFDGTATTDGSTGVTTSTLLTEVDGEAAAGAGSGMGVYNLFLRSATDSEIEMIMTEHIFNGVL